MLSNRYSGVIAACEATVRCSDDASSERSEKRNEQEGRTHIRMTLVDGGLQVIALGVLSHVFALDYILIWQYL